MPELPESNVDVYFGSVDAELPEWLGPENAEADENEEDEPLSEESRKALIGILGFDPDELEGDDPQ